MKYNKILGMVLMVVIMLTGCTRTRPVDTYQENIDNYAIVEQYAEDINMKLYTQEDRESYTINLVESETEYGIIFCERKSRDPDISSYTFEKEDAKFQINYVSYDDIDFAVLSINDEELRNLFDRASVEINDKKAKPFRVDLFTENYVMLFDNRNIETEENRFILTNVEFLDDRDNVIKEKIVLKVNEEESIDLFKIEDMPDDYQAMDMELINGEVILTKGKQGDYYSDLCDGIIINVNNSNYEIGSGMPTIPEISRDKTKFMYVDSIGFEVIGNLYLYKSTNQTITKLTDMIYRGGVSIYGEEFMDNTIRDIEWANDNQILLVIGYAHGTVSEGGDLYLYDINDSSLNMILESKEDSEILKVSKQSDTILIKFKQWLDDNYDSYEIKEYSIPIADLDL